MHNFGVYPLPKPFDFTPPGYDMRILKKFYLGMVLAALAMPSIVSADIVTSLQDSWTLDGDATSSTGTHDGTYVSGDGLEADYVDGKFDQGIDLERGDGEFLDIDNSVTDFDNVGGSITVSAWVNFEDNPSNWQAVISNGEGGAWRMATGRNANVNQPFWAAGGNGEGGGGADIGSGGTEFDAEDTDFHLLVGTFDGATNTSNFYVDGVLTGTVTNVGGLTDNQSGLQAADPTVDPPVTALGIVIGNNSDDRRRNFDGIIDDVGIWDIALTQADVDQIWNGGAGTPIADLVGGLTPTGDFDGDGDVDCDDLDGYVGNIGAAATGALAALDIDGNGTLEASDADTHIRTLVRTSNGVVGTFPGDLNCDGSVNVLGDAFALVGNLNNSATSYSQGDINFDGVVNVLGDAFQLIGNLNNSNQ